MLPIKRRVRKESFAKIMKDGVFLHAPDFYLRFLDRKDEFPSLFGFVVPNKVKNTSVGRHLIKRKVSSVVEKTLADIKNGFSCLVFTKKDISKLPYSEIEKEILDLLRKARVLG